MHLSKLRKYAQYIINCYTWSILGFTRILHYLASILFLTNSSLLRARLLNFALVLAISFFKQIKSLARIKKKKQTTISKKRFRNKILCKFIPILHIRSHLRLRYHCYHCYHCHHHFRLLATHLQAFSFKLIRLVWLIKRYLLKSQNLP